MRALRVRTFFGDESGPTAVEYAVMLALIVLGCIGAIRILGGSTESLWNRNVDAVRALAPGGGGGGDVPPPASPG